MENSNSKIWMESSRKAIIVKLPVHEMPPVSRIGAPLRKCSSETKISASKFEGFEIKRYKNKVVIIDTTSSSSSSSATTLVAKNFLPREIDLLDDFERNMDSEFSGMASGSSGLSRSCSTIVKIPEKCTFPLTRSSSSCCDLSRPHETMEVLPQLEALREYNKATKMYKLYINTSIIVEEFLQAKYQFELSYPNYWKHLNKKMYIDLDSETSFEETECQIDFIETCKTLLEEESDLGNEGVIFPELSGEDIMNDFEACALFMKHKFPYLFTYLMKKYDFDKFSTKKLLVKKNRQEIIKLLKQPHEELSRREAKYMPK